MGINVLVVDDSSTMRSMVARTLQMSGLPIGEISQAANGQEGLDVLERQWVDLVLVDINMPVMGGLEMIQKLREKEQFARLPVVVVSTESSQTRIEQVQQQGVQFIHKPFTPEIIRQVIGQLVEDIADATA
jgi:two-component system, chemotaxis family, chemotaxis protein CheY